MDVTATPAQTVVLQTSAPERVFTSREFIVSLIVILIGCGLIYKGKMGEGMELITWGATGYLGSRTATKITEILAKK